MHLLLLATPMANFPADNGKNMAALATDAHMLTVWVRAAKDNAGVPFPGEKGEKVFGHNYLKSKQEVLAAVICSDVPNMPFGSSSSVPAWLRPPLEI